MLRVAQQSTGHGQNSILANIHTRLYKLDIRLYTYVHVYTQVCNCMYVCMYVYIYIYVYMCIYIYIYIYIYLSLSLSLVYSGAEQVIATNALMNLKSPRIINKP